MNFKFNRDIITSTLFPDFLYPRSNEPNTSLYANNFGSAGAPNITVSPNGTILSSCNIHSNPLRQKSILHPLTNPQNHDGLPVYCETKDIMLKSRPYSLQTQIIETDCYNQYHSFCNDYTDVIFETLLGINSDYEEKKFCTQNRIRRTSTYIKKLLNSKQVQAFSHVKKAKLETMPQPLRMIMEQNIIDFDIPKDIILDYLDEELMNTYELESNDPNLGNTIAFADTLNPTEQCILLYPSGALGNDLNIISIETDMAEREVQTFSIPKKRLLKKFSLKGTIREIKTYSNIWGCITVAAIRTPYTLSILLDDKPSTGFHVAHTIASTDEIASFNVNPYLENEVLLALHDGSFCLFTDGTLRQVSSPWKHHQSVDNTWTRVIHSSCPRKFLAVQKTEATLHDIRTSSANCKTLYKFPLEYSGKEYFTQAANTNPLNRYQYYLTTNRSLLIFDDRFMGEPMSRHYHHMDNDPQFMEVVTKNKNEVFICLGSYAKRETRYMEISQISTRNNFMADEMFKLDLKETIFPPLCSEMLQLGNYSDWISNIQTKNVFKSKQVEKLRLKKQLTGIAIAKSFGSDNDCLAVQRSRCGDIFFQYLTLDVSHNKNLQPNLDDDIKYYQNWIELAYNDIIESDFKLSQKNLLFVKTAIPKQSLVTKSLINNSRICERCKTLMEDEKDDDNNMEDRNLDTNKTMNEDMMLEYCCSCGLEYFNYDNMKNVYNKQGIITLRNMRMNCDVDTSKKQVTTNSKDLLIGSLQENWRNETYIPLMDYVPMETSKVNTNNDVNNLDEDVFEVPEIKIMSDKNSSSSQPIQSQIAVELNISNNNPLLLQMSQSQQQLNDIHPIQGFSSQPIQQFATHEEQLFSQTQDVMSQGSWDPLYTSSQTSRISSQKKAVNKPKHSMGF